MANYVLIHGAWHGAWSWRKIAPLLVSKGHTVLTPDLPGHGEDQTPVEGVTLAAYAERICAVAAQAPPVILVGHSMGGVAITEAAERCPENLAALVYLAAFMPGNGEPMVKWTKQDQESLANPNVRPLPDGLLEIDPEGAAKAFYSDCSPEDREFGVAHLQKQAVAPIVTPLATSSERWGRVPRYYIECARDRAVTPALQRAMQANNPCRRTFTLDTDHSPFLSAPADLAEVLLKIAAELESERST